MLVILRSTDCAKMWKPVIILLSLCVLSSSNELLDVAAAIYKVIFGFPDDLITTGSKINGTSPKVQMTVALARKYGYPIETHKVVTEDGYLLTVHRIPGSPKSPPSVSKRPVLLVHGLGACSDTWLLVGPDNGIGFLLADEGYDVWLGNNRGNFYSREHVSLSPEEPTYWNFTYHEMGVYDVPAVIDHILEVTGQKQIICIGHSLGTNILFVTASVRPEYNKNIRLIVLLTPSVYLSFRTKVLQLLQQNFREISRALQKVGIYELLPRTAFTQQLLRTFCRDDLPTFWICMVGYLSFFGGTMKTFNTTLAPVIFSHAGAGYSVFTVAHLYENIETGRFQWYDHTYTKGKLMPTYDLGKVTPPVAIYYAKKDIFVHPDNITRLKAELPNVVRSVKIAYEDTSHVDIVFGKQAKKYVYSDLFDLMRQYS